MRWMILGLALLACGADVEREDVNHSCSASATPCVRQCFAMAFGDCPGEPPLFWETCSENCETEADIQPDRCAGPFNAMWDCRIEELVAICGPLGGPVGTYPDGACGAETDAYTSCMVGEPITP